jgi:phosphohistidine swiveling domain-containing protein
VVVIATGALTVNAAVLALAKEMPVEVVPAMETW